MYYSQFVEAEEIQHNIDIHCGEKKQMQNYLVIYSSINYNF